MGASVRISDATFAGNDQIRPLTPGDVERLSLDPRRGLDHDDLLSLVIQLPGLSFWHPATGEFILVTPWRHRMDLPSVHTISAFQHETALLRAATEAARDANAAALMYVDSYEIRRPAFYVKHGFQRIEEIVTYELLRPRVEPLHVRSLTQRFVRVPIHDEAWLQAVMEVDHDAFPWLWWNSRAEFSSYLQFPGVEIWAGLLDEDIVTYIGLTHYHGWGHLDRIATRSDYQGRGLGREALTFAIDRMASHGSKRIALSTQGNNLRSQRMYLGYGFRQTPNHNYAVYGIVFDPERVEAGTRP